MPAKSKAQLKYLNTAAVRGEVSQKVADDFNHTSKGLKLPEYAPKLNKLGKYLKKKDQ